MEFQSIKKLTLAKCGGCTMQELGIMQVRRPIDIYVEDYDTMLDADAGNWISSRRSANGAKHILL